MFTAVAAVAMPPHIAATVAVVSRLVFVAADALGAAAAVPLARTAVPLARTARAARPPDS